MGRGAGSKHFYSTHSTLPAPRYTEWIPMFASKLQIRLPRKITAYFLLFGLAALVWLSVGAVYVAYTVTDSRSESTSLRSLGRGSDRIVLTYLRDKNADFQVLLAELRTQSGATYCAIASPTGEFLAHTNVDLRGKPVTENGARTERWGQVERVEFTTAGGVTIHEYRCPLKAADKDLGVFRLGIAQSSVWNHVASGAQFAPLALLGPACCMIVGAVLLNRLVRPVADIEQQLHQVATSPSLESCEWREVPNVGAAAIGWNRVVQQKLAVGQRESLHERVRHSLDQGRQGRLDAVLNSIPDGVATTDLAGRLTYTNLPMAVILGLKNSVGGGDGASEAEGAPLMTEQLIQRWHMPETDELLSAENRDRAVVTELTARGKRPPSDCTRRPSSRFASSAAESRKRTSGRCAM